MLNCIIVDDEAHACELLKTYVEKVPFLHLIKAFNNPIDALSYLQKEAVDLIFLDIQMPELTGIEFLRIFGGKSKVIITSAYTEYALEGYEHNVLDYLLKPIAFDRFFKAAQKAINIASTVVVTPYSPEQSENFILVKTESKGKMVKINIQDIFYIEGMKNYVSIYTQKDRIIALLNIKDLEKKLSSSSSHFLRIHKSYIVNISRIDTIENNQILLKGLESRKNNIPLGITYRDAFYRMLSGYIMERK